MKLPTKVKIPKQFLKSKQYDDITNYLSDKFGFCINDYKIKNGYAIDINWDTTD